MRDDVAVGHRVLISGGLTDPEKRLSNVYNTRRKLRRRECMMTMRICEYPTEGGGSILKLV